MILSSFLTSCRGENTYETKVIFRIPLGGLNALARFSKNLSFCRVSGEGEFSGAAYASPSEK